MQPVSCMTNTMLHRVRLWLPQFQWITVVLYVPLKLMVRTGTVSPPPFPRVLCRIRESPPSPTIASASQST
jgi:hypothetical protein